MIITVKNLQQQTFTVEFEPEKTVVELKEKIFKERGPEYIMEKQKLIYAGVILEDERTIASYNVDEKKFIVVMLKRDLCCAKKVQESGNTVHAASSGGNTSDDRGKSTSISATGACGETNENKTGLDEDTKLAENESGLSALVVTGANIQSNISGMSALTTGSANSGGMDSRRCTFSSGDLAGVFSNTSLQTRAESNLLMGEEYNRSVESMIEMGYCREMVERAMAASFNNPERAVEYLISGIPDSSEGFNPPHLAEERGSMEGGVEVPAAEGHENVDILAGSDPFEFLRNQPQFLQMRSLVYQNPDLLHAVLQQIGQTNPALLQLISENQDAFLNMLNEPIEGQQTSGQQYARRINPSRRAQLAAAARAAADSDVVHVPSLDTAAGSGGDGPSDRPASSEGGDAGIENQAQRVGTVTHTGSATELRAVASDAFMRDREAAAAAVAALTAAASAAVERNITGSGGGARVGGEGHDVRTLATQQRNLPSYASGADGDGIATIRLNREDQDAIDRLKALGFPEALVLQAYFACDKDEQLAANFLISSVFDD